MSLCLLSFKLYESVFIKYNIKEEKESVNMIIASLTPETMMWTIGLIFGILLFIFIFMSFLDAM